MDVVLVGAGVWLARRARDADDRRLSADARFARGSPNPASQHRLGENDLSVGVLAVVGLVSVYGKSDYFSRSVLAGSVLAAGVFTNRSHSSLLCPKLIRSPTSLLEAFI